MTRTIQKSIVSGLLLAGLTFAQTATPSAPPAQSGNGRWSARAGAMRGHGIAKFGKFLQLTDDQKAQAKAIFEASKPQVQPLREQMRTARQELFTAVKNGAPDNEVVRLSNQVGNLTAQLTAIHARNMAKFYSILTPEQKAKLDQARQNHMNRRGSGAVSQNG